MALTNTNRDFAEKLKSFTEKSLGAEMSSEPTAFIGCVDPLITAINTVETDLISREPCGNKKLSSIRRQSVSLE